MSVSNPEPANFRGLSVEHPRLVQGVKDAKKNGLSKEDAARVIGMPLEVVDKIYKREDEKK